MQKCKNDDRVENSGTGNRTRGCPGRQPRGLKADDVNPYTIPDGDFITILRLSAYILVLNRRLPP